MVDQRRRYVWLLAAVTLVGLVLRLVSLGSDLWLDELSPVVNSRNTTVLQVFLTRFSFNNHLLNNLLVKAAMSVFGEREWAVRLPAMLWGTATIPAMYWVSRQLLSRHASLCSALLLAVSYHHIFFSQDARGYTSYLFLSLVSSVLLVKGLRTGAPQTWTAFVLTTVLNFAALLLSGFVFAAHIIVAGLSLFRIPQGGERSRALRRLSMVFGGTAVLGCLIYVAVVPQMLALLRPTYADPSSGFSPFSLELFRELARGIGAGFGPGWLLGAVPFLGLAAAGYVILVRRHWTLAMALTLPCLLQATFFVTLKLIFYPRMFILALPLTILVAVQAISTASDALARALKRDASLASWVRGGVVLLLCVVSVAALPRYYTTPKQPYRASLAHVESARQPDGIVIEIHYAGGLKYYRERANVDSGMYFQARTVETLDAIVAAHRGRPVWLVTTFPRALRSAVPDLDARIKRDWEIDRTFRGTVGDGDISVWRPK